MADKSIRITDEAHQALRDKTEKQPVYKMGYYASIAIMEKIERERTHENPVLERNQPEK